ncbi:Outer membrane stress sensor protease DegS [Alloactinosynnema sp. L-07]|uniref:S8 family serine peptidase n=1 Tax=Alloactinosynnema sp. L-07 TaxID=1653480 RepID=UPI00065F019C|nr:S8 family serine peptidase [Alloactinosynnema sp. L-07]CRK61629.1 Outer membrane stress sensor protease DegS [Alloactinosynnema sp. L-07]
MIQPEWRRRSRIALGMVAATAVVGTMMAVVPSAGAAPTPQAPAQAEQGSVGLDKHDQELLAKAESAGKKTVRVMIATTEGDSARKADELAAAGAKIEYRADKIGYVRAEVPIDKAATIAKLANVAGFELEESLKLDDPRPQGIEDPTPQDPPGSHTQRVNPYMPTTDTNAAEFVNEHPTWDGRGTTVAIVDSGVDLDHPALNTTSTGERKITDWVTSTDPRVDNDPTWLHMTNKVTGASVGLPAEAEVRFTEFNERDARLGGEVGNDVNRDGNPAGSKGKFGVAWNPATATVWVDTDQDGSFANNKAMTDYKVKYDIGVFGTDNPATPVKESMTFVVQTNVAKDAVNIGIVSGAHGSHVAGIVAGNSLFGGPMSGAAPGAKLVSLRVCQFVAGCTNFALMEAMVYAVEVAKVDVINMSVGGLPALNDGNDSPGNDRAILYNRLIDTYNVQMFISAGNSGAGVNTVGDPSVVTKVMSVGSYITRYTWQSNYGSDMARFEALHGFSSRGPREDGGFKPNIIAPGSAISTVPTWQNGQPVAGTYVLPPGFAQFNGTSMASPQAAGSAALLVSAAKAKNVSHTAAQLRTAFQSSARFVTALGAYEQGAGLIDTKKAWNVLKANPSTTEITAAVPVNTLLSAFLKNPGIGTGIHDREGVKQGQKYTREYTFTRTTGPDSPVTYKAKWVGNDGTFSSAGSVTLPKNSAVKFKVEINPATTGMHSALLNLDSPTTTGVELQTMNSVIVADQFTASNNYTVVKGGELDRNETASHFFNIPAGTPALKVDLQGGGSAAGAGQIRFLRFHPYGVGIDSGSSLNCYNPPVPGSGCASGSPTTRSLSNPQPGVWEIVVEARRTSDSAQAPYTLTTSVLGASVSPNPDVIPSATIGTPVDREYTLKNTLGAFNGRATGTTLGSAKQAMPSIAHQQEQIYPITVTPGSTQLRVTIGGTSDLGADLDLDVYHCVNGNCVLRGQSADGDSEESVTIANPTAGQWEARVQGFDVPAGSTTFNYVDVFTNAAFGSVAVTDANAARAAGTQWTVPGKVTANAAPAAGRVLLGTVEVRTDANILVGTGDVVVQAVS